MNRTSAPSHRLRPSLRPTWLALAVAAAVSPASRAADEPAGVFSLGEVEVTGTRPSDDSRIDRAGMQRDDTLNAGAALAELPGVVMSRIGARNEVGVQVRGFDLRQVPLFVDGVPVYVPYDGYVDLGRFTTFDLARVEVEKGNSSMLYGANTLGGAINLVSRKPVKPLEVGAGMGLVFDRSIGTNSATWQYADIGTRQEHWYAQLNASVFDQDSYGLPASFVPHPAEDGGARNNSQAYDRKANLKLAWLPRGDDEYTLNFIDQHGVKGTPPYAGDVASVTPRYWTWPYWDKQSYYGATRTALGEHVLKLRVFHDTFRNSLFAWDNATYSTMKKPSSFESFYDDFSNGASAQLDLKLPADTTLGLAAHWKEDIHREHNLGEPIRHFKDQTTSLDAEASHLLRPGSELLAGLGYDTRRTLQAEDYNSTTKTVLPFQLGSGDATNGQIAWRQDLTSGWQGELSLARKSRFPTIKDRYSYKMGTAQPNPDLKPEHATHLQLTLKGTPAPGLHIEAAVFHSDIHDLIQSVTIAQMCGTNACNQTQNIGKARSQGFELGGDWQIGAWQFDGHYQYLDRDNLSNPAVLLTDTPRHAVVAHAGWKLAPAWTLHAEADASTSRWSSSTGNQLAHGFAVLNLKASWQPLPQATLELAVHNVTDRLYAYTEGYPEPGRQLWLQGRLSFL